MEDCSANDANTGTSEKVKKPTKTKVAPKAKKPIQDGPYKTGRWTKDEHFRFLAALKLFGKEWKNVQ